jgi:hypothetical protein
MADQRPFTLCIMGFKGHKRSRQDTAECVRARGVRSVTTERACIASSISVRACVCACERA